MPRFSQRSTRRLASCHPDLQRLFRAVIRRRDCTVLEGQRSDERQARLFEQGKSKIKSGGKHCTKPLSEAVDVAPWPIPKDWEPPGFVAFGRLVVGVAEELAIPIRWGGDWDGDGDRTDQTFDDLVHFERKAK